MLNGDYYTLTEAADFIASKTGKKNDKDVLLDAKNGKIRLCIWSDGTLYKFNRDKGTGKLQSIDDYKFSGYIQIPKKRITPEGGTIQFGSITIIEVKDEWIWAKNRDPRTLDDNELSDRYFDSQSNSYQPHNLFADLEKALIPEQDLLNFIEESGRCEELESMSILGQNKRIGRPKSIEKNARVLKQIIESLTDGKEINPTELPGSADNLLEACKRIAQAKSRKNMFSISLDAFKKWLKATGYGFGNGRTPANEKNYWTNLGAKNI